MGAKMWSCDSFDNLTRIYWSQTFFDTKVLSYLFKTINFMSKINRKPSSFSLGQCSINPVQMITVFPLGPKFGEISTDNLPHFGGTFWKFRVIMRNKSLYQLLSTDMVRIKPLHHHQYQSILGKGHWIPEKGIYGIQEKFQNVETLRDKSVAAMLSKYSHWQYITVGFIEPKLPF